MSDKKAHIDNVVHERIIWILDLPYQLLCLQHDSGCLLFPGCGIPREGHILCHLAELIC